MARVIRLDDVRRLKSKPKSELSLAERVLLLELQMVETEKNISELKEYMDQYIDHFEKKLKE